MIENQLRGKRQEIKTGASWTETAAASTSAPGRCVQTTRQEVSFKHTCRKTSPSIKTRPREEQKVKITSERNMNMNKP